MATKTQEGATAGTEAQDDDTAVEAAGTEEGTARAQSREDGSGQPDAAEDATAEAKAAEAKAAEEKPAEGKAAGEGALEGDAAGEEAAADVAAAEGAAEEAAGREKAPSGVGQGAGAVVSAALGFVSLSGGWIGTVAGAREQLVGQLRTSSTASVATQIKAVYGNAWHSTALWAGLFALAALLTGVVVLARPAFGTPGHPQAHWIKSVAWGGVSLGVIGLLLAVLKYSDALLALPSTS
ncbi:hypothetical protein [Streptomyces sp. NBC_00557]|uniref:hypothetical protein n=1 Tax=Streptomyces sp. NBC_00557 TaxID=2975776 RepID=UPI002E813B86|nr:hypothetical protein [Streptomyces sp. NBC_00557]WUC34587.1 hypothetical protein OG956_10380 [Streptomyces sp. NBC_00557]